MNLRGRRHGDLLRQIWCVLCFRAPIGRAGFVLGLVSCLILKQWVDRRVLALLGVPHSGRVWSILLGMELPTREDLEWGWRLLAASLPFLWAGLALTAARLRSMGRSAAWSLLFLVPILKFLMALVLMVAPEARLRVPPVIQVPIREPPDGSPGSRRVAGGPRRWGLSSRPCSGRSRCP